MSAGANGPGHAIVGGPQADTLSTATGRQIAREPLVQFGVEHHNRIAKVGAVSVRKRWRGNLGEGGAAIGRVGRSRILVGIVIVDS